MERRFQFRLLIGMMFFTVVLSGWAADVLATANPTNKVITFTITYPKDESNDAVDYTLGIPFLRKDQIDLTKTAGKFFDKLVDVRDERPRGGNGLTLFFENKNGTLFKPGSSDAITIYVLNAPKSIRPFTGTSVVRKQMGAGRVPTSDNLPLVGFVADPDPEYMILNDLEDPFAFEIRDLQFLLNVAEFPDTSLLLDFDNSYGFGSSQPSFFVDSIDEGSELFFIPGVVEDFNWFYARGKLFIDDVEVSRFLHGNQPLPVVIPEPTSLLLIGSGLLGLAFSKRLNF